MESALRTRVLHIVKDEYCAFRNPAEDLLEEVPREGFDAGQIFGRQVGQGLFVARRRLPDCKSHVVKERCKIGVARVDLVPQTWSRARIEPACGERRLTRPGGSYDPSST